MTQDDTNSSEISDPENTEDIVPRKHKTISRRKAMADLLITGAGAIGFGGMLSTLVFTPRSVFAGHKSDNDSDILLEDCTVDNFACVNPFSCVEPFTCQNAYGTCGPGCIVCEAPCIVCHDMPPPCGLEHTFPVTLTNFSTVNSASGIEIRWVTATEVNNAGFNIYRSDSQNGKYMLLTPMMLPGADNSNVSHNYHFTDTTAKPNTIYWYLLEEISNSGGTAMHGPISGKIETIPPTNFMMYPNFPNPFNSETTFYFDIPKAGFVHVEIYTMSGQLVGKSELYCGSGRNEWKWNTGRAGISNFSSGTYICRMTINGHSMSRKISYLK